MLCFLSGQVPAEPVASRKSGHVFEKRLLLQYLAQNQQRCPATGDELDAETDLLPLQPGTRTGGSSAANGSGGAATAAALSPDGASIPQLLATFQKEWDGVILESFSLKQHLEKTRQELSHALYQYDAACRVIARLNAENAALRDKLSARATGSSDDVDMDADAAAPALSAEAVAAIEATQKALAKQRKDFKKTVAPARAERLAGLGAWAARSTHTLHDAAKPGVLCVAVDPKQPARVATGGVDRHVQVFDTAAQQLGATLAGHSKRVSHVAFHPTADLLVSASHDKTVKVWSPAEAGGGGATGSGSGYRVAHSLAGHDGAVTAASIHATGDFVLSASSDASWGFHDLRTGKLLARGFLGGGAAAANAGNEALAAQFHPDGGIFGTGAKNHVLQMWDVKSLANVATFDGHAAPVSSLCFSENGYQLASGAHDGVVKFWDLRKLKSYCELDLNAAVRKKIGSVHEVSYDASGTHLAVAVGAHVAVLKEAGKTAWELVQSFDAAHKAAVTGVKFAPDSSFLATASMDRSLKIFR
ncbi:hypothetical protein PybrP1_011430 [[Pythium] brassicae (nom. inval.)]|nr:hypothetical protein PybrP1_011430 [[Pythium] brassicae (nom. inval.)]